MPVPFYTLRVYGADIVVADAFADRPLVVLAVVGDVAFGLDLWSRWGLMGGMFGLGEAEVVVVWTR